MGVRDIYSSILHNAFVSFVCILVITTLENLLKMVTMEDIKMYSKY